MCYKSATGLQHRGEFRGYPQIAPNTADLRIGNLTAKNSKNTKILSGDYTKERQPLKRRRCGIYVESTKTKYSKLRSGAESSVLMFSVGRSVFHRFCHPQYSIFCPQDGPGASGFLFSCFPHLKFSDPPLCHSKDRFFGFQPFIIRICL